MPNTEHQTTFRPSTPHDAFFRRALDEPTSAAPELRAVLPSDLANLLDLDHLTLVPTSVVDEELRHRHSDLLFTVPFYGHGEHFIYVLIEHQSEVDPLLAFRVVVNTTRILDRYLREHPDTNDIPKIFTVVLHHGWKPGTKPAQMLDLINVDRDLAEIIRPYIPHVPFVVADLAQVAGRT